MLGSEVRARKRLKQRSPIIQRLLDAFHQESDISQKIKHRFRPVKYYEEISEEEAGITRRQFLTKALRISFGAFAGIQILTYLGFLFLF